MQNDKVTFQYKPEGSEALNHVNIWCKRVQEDGRINTKTL